MMKARKWSRKKTKKKETMGQGESHYKFDNKARFTSNEAIAIIEHVVTVMLKSYGFSRKFSMSNMGRAAISATIDQTLIEPTIDYSVGTINGQHAPLGVNTAEGQRFGSVRMEQSLYHFFSIVTTEVATMQLMQGGQFGTNFQRALINAILIILVFMIQEELDLFPKKPAPYE